MNQAIPHRIGVYLAAVQFLFATTWTAYVIFLPQLAAQVGIAKEAVVFILLLDQVIFGVMDFSMGVMADKVSRTLGRLGHVVLGATVVSCIAFLLLPFVAAQGNRGLFLLFAVVWLVTSSALRAPPLVLLGKYAAKPAQPWLSALSLFGLGVAGAIAPYLTVALRDADPRLPFAVSSLALLLATIGILWAERALAAQAAAPSKATLESAEPLPPVFWFLFGVVLLALGFQVHFSLNSAPLYLRFAKPSDLEYLMPIFWGGFSLMMLPASWATKRYGGLVVMGAGGLVGALAIYFAAGAGNLHVLMATQFLAGGAWGCILMSAVAAALAIGAAGREGKVTGALFALLALAACARFAILAAKLPQDPQLALLLKWAPAVAWAVGGIGLLLLLLPKRIRSTA